MELEKKIRIFLKNLVLRGGGLGFIPSLDSLTIGIIFKTMNIGILEPFLLI